MEKSELAWIKLRGSLLTVGALLFVNCLVVATFFQTLYVAQTDFSKLQPDRLTSQIDRIGFELPKKACLEVNGLTDETAKKIQEKVGFSAQCDQGCGICFSITEAQQEIKRQALMTVKEDKVGAMVKVDVQLKNANKLPRDFATILSKISSQYGCVSEQHVEAPRPTLH